MDFKFSIDEENIDKIVVECFIARLRQSCLEKADTWSSRDEIKKVVSESFSRQIEAVASKIFSEMESLEAEVRAAAKEKIMRKLERIK